MATTNLIYNGLRWNTFKSSGINVVEPDNNKTVPIGGNSNYTYTTIFEFKIPSDTIVSQLNGLSFTLQTTGGSSLNYVGNLFCRASNNPFVNTSDAVESIGKTSEGWLAQSTAQGGYSLTFTFNFNSTPTNFSKDYVLCLMVHSCYKGNSSYADGTIRQRFGYKDIYNIQSTGTITYTSYTKNTAPTSVKIKESIAVAIAGSNVTLQWSGAGTVAPNSISGYTIYYKDGGVPTLSTNDGNYSTTSTECLVEVPSTYGQTRYFKVVAESSHSGYSSDISSATASIKANTPPLAPSVTIDKDSLYKQIVPSTGGTVIFKPTPGNSNDLNQTASVWYSTTSDGTKTPITTPTFSPTIREKTTYYFWTHDGLEYSEKSFDITIERNVKPNIIIGEIKSKEYTSNDTTYTSSLSIPLSFNKKQSRLIYTLNYIIDGQSKQAEKVGDLTVSEETTIDLNINELLSEFYNNKKIEYYISFVIEDSYEFSASVETAHYFIAAAPQINTTELPTEFYSSLRIPCDKDTEITSISCEIQKGDNKFEGLVYRLDSTYYSDEGYVDIAIDSILDVSTEIKIILNFSNGSFDKTSSFDIIALKGYKLQSFSIDPFLIKPFSSSTEVGEATIEWPFQGDEVEKGCECGLRYIYNGNISEVTFDSNSIVRTSDSLTLNYKYNHCLNFYENSDQGDGYGGALCGTNIYLCGTYQVQISMFIDAGYAVFDSEVQMLEINFEEQPTEIKFSMGYLKDDSFVSFSNTQPLREGIVPTFQLSFTQHTQAIPMISILRSSDNINWTNYYSYTPEDFDYFVNNHQQSFNISTSAFSEIDKVYSGNSGDILYFKVVIGVSSSLSEPPQIEVQARKFTSSEISIKTIEYDDEQNITIGYTVKKGYGNDGPTTTEVRLIAESGLEPIVMEDFTEDLLNATQVTIINNNELPSILTLHLEFTSTYTYNYNDENIILTKISSSSTFVKFSNAPTVSYRQNLIGINASNIDNDTNASESALIIKQTSSKKYITLIGATEEGEALGQIDLSTGALSGFVVYGGTW